jgi:hypothetical protein
MKELKKELRDKFVSNITGEVNNKLFDNLEKNIDSTLRFHIFCVIEDQLYNSLAFLWSSLITDIRNGGLNIT